MGALSILATVCGWTYFVCWSVSFYPQIFRNWQRKSVVGLSFDFLVYNLLGFSCYSVYQCALFWDSKTISEYQHEHDGEKPTVEINDVVFALHGEAMVILTIFQCFIYERGSQRVSYVCMAITSLLLAGIAIMGVLVASPWVKLVWWIEGLGYVKAGITFIKYSPQVYVNYKLKSTEGWSIWQVLLDVAGGLLSFLQNGLNAVDKGDTAPFQDYPKLALAIISLVFDAIFIVQHYILYRHPPQYTNLSESEHDSDADRSSMSYVDYGSKPRTVEVADGDYLAVADMEKGIYGSINKAKSEDNK